MLDLEQGRQELGAPIIVEPSNRLFEELGNNTYTYLDLLSELIDNSIAARNSDETVHITLTVGVSNDRQSSWLSIKDNAAGIRHERLPMAISPAAMQNTDSLNEHGLGMKQAIAGLGSLRYLATKAAEAERASVIEELQFGKIYPKMVDVDWMHGTEIVIDSLKGAVKLHTVSYTRDLIPMLGARYRRFLVGPAPTARIKITMVDVDDDQREINTWRVQERKPVYFHPRTRTNAPVVDHKEFRGTGWEAELTFGYKPEGHEWQETGIAPPTRFDPYAVSIAKQGLDIIMNNRVIVFHQLAELGFVGVRHNNYNNITGEIVLKKGFTTAITKNAIIRTEQWDDCMKQMKDYLNGANLIKSRTYPDALPENALRDRMANFLQTNPLVGPRQSVQIEYAVEALGGAIDILADDEVWEIKRDDANGMDVWQCFAYMDMTGKTKGFLLAKSFRPSAHATVRHINDKHNVHITLTELQQYPINHPLTEQEVDKYLQPTPPAYP